MITAHEHPVKHDYWIAVVAPVAERISIPIEQVSIDDLWHFGVGDCDTGAACSWWPGR